MRGGADGRAGWWDVTGGHVMTSLRYRDHSPHQPRVRRGALRYTDHEWAVIVLVAARVSMRPGAWAQHAAYEAAARLHRGLAHDRSAIDDLIAELRQHRRVLTNIGGNLNDVARAANSTGSIENPVAAETVLRLVSNVVRDGDELIRRIGTELVA